MFADVSPATTNRDSGSSGSRAGLSVLNVTVAPPAGAGAVRSTLPRASPPLNFGDGKVTAPTRRVTGATTNVPVAENAVYASVAPM